ncbi:ABC-three component system protein [Rhizobium leguminosarum]|uniref:ABC-three component system protein n=1 Tax=Rhizobium leguminosarum TaxID=384 RepID=UPI001C942CC9|nr:ABC-three component system protein [Rhizobium leguminosarum]MBY5316718.1 hypothetical protein [Rhizobium leguminosarum]
MSDKSPPGDPGKNRSGQLVPYQPNSVVSSAQSDNDVGGHMGGRDVNVVNGDVYRYKYVNQAINTPAEGAKVSVFRRLFEKLEKEAAEDKTLRTYIKQLEVYTRKVENEEVVGLAEKLHLAGRARQLQYAASVKENVYTALKENLFSPTYQLIAATLMAKVHERFETDIRPLIEDGVGNAAVDRAVAEKIIRPFSEELESCPQFEDVAVDYVRGMVFFLTGNCHIRWDKC